MPVRHNRGTHGPNGITSHDEEIEDMPLSTRNPTCRGPVQTKLLNKATLKQSQSIIVAIQMGGSVTHRSKRAKQMRHAEQAEQSPRNNAFQTNVRNTERYSCTHMDAPRREYTAHRTETIHCTGFRNNKQSYHDKHEKGGGAVSGDHQTQYMSPPERAEIANETR